MKNTDVTGDPLDSIGSISVNLSIAHKPMTHALQVVRNCTKPLIEPLMLGFSGC